MIFVTPTGDDSGPGSFDKPFATLGRARDAATPGTVVVLRGDLSARRVLPALRVPLRGRLPGIRLRHSRSGGGRAQWRPSRHGVEQGRGQDRTYRTDIDGTAPRQLYASGGGNYLSGSQGDSRARGALVRGNVVRDTITSGNFAIYTDYGASRVTVEGNVVQRAEAPVASRVSPPPEDVAFLGRIWDTNPGPVPDGIISADNVTLPPEDLAHHPRMAGIAAAAGIRRCHAPAAPPQEAESSADGSKRGGVRAR